MSLERGLDPNLSATVMQIESCGEPDAESSAGAEGLYQVMPFHFGSDEDHKDPRTNAKRGLDYLAKSYLLAQGDLERTLAGYNGGHSRIFQDQIFWPQETKDYVHWGAGIMNDIASGREQSPTLQEWLRAGGASLCEDAQLANLN